MCNPTSCQQMIRLCNFQYSPGIFIPSPSFPTILIPAYSKILSSTGFTFNEIGVHLTSFVE